MGEYFFASAHIGAFQAHDTFCTKDRRKHIASYGLRDACKGMHLFLLGNSYMSATDGTRVFAMLAFILENAPKKKNGTFAKNKLTIIAALPIVFFGRVGLL